MPVRKPSLKKPVTYEPFANQLFDLFTPTVSTSTSTVKKPKVSGK